MHHLLQHFRQNSWHLVEQQMVQGSIRAELEQYNNYSKEHTNMYENTSVLPARLTPLMFSRPYTCASMSTGGLLVMVESRNPQ